MYDEQSSIQQGYPSSIGNESMNPVWIDHACAEQTPAAHCMRQADLRLTLDAVSWKWKPVVYR